MASDPFEGLPVTEGDPFAGLPVADADEGFQTAHGPNEPTTAEVKKASGEIADKLKSEVSSVAATLDKPRAGYRGIMVGLGTRSLDRAAAATERGFEGRDLTEKLEAGLGNLVGDTAIAGATGIEGAAAEGAEAAAGSAPVKAAALAAAKAFGPTGEAKIAAQAALNVRYAQAAAHGASVMGAFKAIDDMAARGEIHPLDLAISATFGAALGMGGLGAADVAHAAFRSAAAKTGKRVMSAMTTRIMTELNMATFRYERGYGVPRETGLVPVDVMEQYLAGHLSRVEAAGKSQQFADMLTRVHGATLPPEAMEAAREWVGQETVELMVQSGLPPEIAQAKVQKALAENAVVSPPPLPREAVASVEAEKHFASTEPELPLEASEGPKAVGAPAKEAPTTSASSPSPGASSGVSGPPNGPEPADEGGVTHQELTEEAQRGAQKPPQPYEMTVDEFQAAHPDLTGPKARETHQRIVAAAEDAGEPIPARVLASLEEDDLAMQAAEDSKSLKALGWKQTPVLTRLRDLGLNKAEIEKAGHLGNFTDIKGVLRKEDRGVGLSRAAEILHSEGLIPENDDNLVLEAIDHESRLKAPRFEPAARELTGAAGASQGPFSDDIEKKSGSSSDQPIEPMANSIPTTPGSVGNMPVKEFRPVSMPILVKIVKEITGKVPMVSRRMGPDTQGLYSPKLNAIKLRPESAEDSDNALKLLGHEVGHLPELLSGYYEDGKAIAPGNIIGRIASLRKYMGNSFGEGEVTNKDLKAELVAFSEKWRPYNRDNARPSFIKYRESASELYADAISALFYSPGVLEQEAPNFYRLFLQNLDAKPEFAESYYGMQHLLAGTDDEVAKMIAADQVASYIKAEEIIKANKAMTEAADRRTMDRLNIALNNRMYVALRKTEIARAAGKDIPLDEDPKYLIEEMGMGNNTSGLQARDWDAQVFRPLEAAGITRYDMGIYMRALSVVTDRAEKYNPGGLTPESATQQVDLLAKKLGREKFALLESGMRKFHDIGWATFEKAAESGLYSQDFLKENLASKYTYGPVRIHRHLEGRISAGVHAVVGTLEDSQNPIDTYMQKVFAVNNATQRQFGNAALIKVLKQLPGEVTPTTYVKEGVPRFVKGKDQHTVYEDGKPVSYDIDPFVARAFKAMPATMLDSIVDFLRLDKITPIFKGLVTHHNPAFVYWNGMIRYLQSTHQNLPESESFLGYLKEYGAALKETQALMRKNEMSPTIRGMIENMETDFRYLNQMPSRETDESTYAMEQLGVVKDGKVTREGLGKLLKPLDFFVETLERHSAELLLAHKVAAHNILVKAGVKGKELAYKVRTYAGVPTNVQHGEAYRVSEAVLPFSSILLRHYQRLAQVAATNPTGKAGYWTKIFLSSVVPAVLGWSAKHGAFGKDVEDHYRRISDFHRTTGDPIVLGSMKGGKHGWKTISVQLPQSEGGRPAHILTYKLLDLLAGEKPGKEMQEIFNYAIDMLPSFNPAITVPYMWTTYARGGRPWDAHLMRDVVPEQVLKKGGWPATRKMMEWTVNQSGQLNLSNYDAAHRTTTEMLFQMLPGFSRPLGITDYGLTEEEKSQKAVKEAHHISHPKRHR